VKVKIDQKDIQILQSLSKGGLIPSLQKISNLTGFSKQFIHIRLEKIAKNSLITNFEPKLNLSKLGLKFSVISLLELDLHKVKKEDTINIFKKISNLDSTVSITPLIPNTNYQLMMHEIFEKQSDYYNHLLKLYENHPMLGEVVKERRVYTVNNEETNIIKEQNYDNVTNILMKRLDKTPYFIILSDSINGIY
jgi:DNA-binding Lrp family transcriptional regulator